MGGTTFVQDLASVLGVAALTGAVARRLGQPSIVGYLLAGVVVGPYIPIPLFADPERVHSLAEFGVVLVMFAVGLEFRVARLLLILPKAGLTTTFQVGAIGWLGYTVGGLVGFSPIERVFLAASVAISSTMVVSTIYDGRKVDRGGRDLVFGVLVVQDLVAIVLLAVLTAVATGSEVSVDRIGAVVAELAVALAGLGLVGLLVVPRAVRTALGLHSAETSLVAVTAVAFVLAGLASALGYSTALGAFLAGVLVAEAGVSHQVDALIRPLRDLFASIFFVSIGMLVDPWVLLANLPVVVLVSAVVVLGQLSSVTVGGVLSGNGLRASVIAGLSLGQVGEFGFLLSELGVRAGAGPKLVAVVVGTSLVTAFTTPHLVAVSDRVVHVLDARAPRRLQRILAMYETWFERLRSARSRSPVARTAAVVAADAALIVLVAVGAAMWNPWVTARLVEAGAPLALARAAVPIAAGAVALPLIVGAVRSTRSFARIIAADVVATGREDRGAGAVRRLIEAAIQLLVLLGLGVPTIAVVRPFLGPAGNLLAFLGIFVVVAANQVWRRVGELEGDVQSGASDVARLLARPQPQAAPREDPPSLPGFEDVAAIKLPPESPAVGRTLAELDLRVVTGASVVAIARKGAEVLSPTGHERLEAGDVLGLLGAGDAVRRARTLLLGPPPADRL